MCRKWLNDVPLLKGSAEVSLCVAPIPQKFAHHWEQEEPIDAVCFWRNTMHGTVTSERATHGASSDGKEQASMDAKEE